MNIHKEHIIKMLTMIAPTSSEWIQSKNIIISFLSVFGFKTPANQLFLKENNVRNFIDGLTITQKEKDFILFLNDGVVSPKYKTSIVNYLNTCNIDMSLYVVKNVATVAPLNFYIGMLNLNESKFNENFVQYKEYYKYFTNNIDLIKKIDIEPFLDLTRKISEKNGNVELFNNFDNLKFTIDYNALKNSVTRWLKKNNDFSIKNNLDKIDFFSTFLNPISVTEKTNDIYVFKLNRFECNKAIVEKLISHLYKNNENYNIDDITVSNINKFHYFVYLITKKDNCKIRLEWFLNFISEKKEISDIAQLWDSTWQKEEILSDLGSSFVSKKLKVKI